MRKAKSLWIVAVFSAFAVFAIPTAGSAAPKQKISYEEAFKRCKTIMDKEKGSLGAGTTADANKSTRGAACMKRFGHRL